MTAGSVVGTAGAAGATAAASSTTTTTVPALNPRGEPPPAAVPRPFGRLACTPSAGVRLCRGGFSPGRDLRIPSFDGVPLDADVTLPPTGSGPFPLIVLLHGLGGTKVSYESSVDDGSVDNVSLAARGFAVLTYTARGFGDSCGTAASRAATPACARGWSHLADQRFEIRDTQYLAGLLVDEGLVLPTIGVAGVSYGGGQSLELAMLRDRIRLPDGGYAPFTSPHHHVPMTVGAVYAIWPWDDLVSALVPNGNPAVGTAFASSAATAAGDTAADRQPVGVAKESWLVGLYSTMRDGYLAPPGADPGADITTWFHQALAGEPPSPAFRRMLTELATEHSAAGITPSATGPAATVLQSGWGDSLFPVSEALHYIAQFGNALSDPAAPLLSIFDDVGHPWAQSKPADLATSDRLGIAFLQAVLQGKGTPPTGVVAIGQTCPRSAPSGPVVPAHFVTGLQQGTVTVTGNGAQVVDWRTRTVGLDPPTGSRLCQARPPAASTGTAIYRQPVGPEGFLLLGPTQVTASLTIRGRFPELIGQLWDVGANGQRQIVALGAFRPSVNQSAATPPGAVASEQATFSLEPAEYTFAPGHTVELDLVAADAPMFRESNGRFSIQVSGFQASLPTGTVPTLPPPTY